MDGERGWRPSSQAENHDKVLNTILADAKVHQRLTTNLWRRASIQTVRTVAEGGDEWLVATQLAYADWSH